MFTKFGSHPTWVRGLKQLGNPKGVNENRSHPTWVRGLKLNTSRKKWGECPSHPTWVRGLKLGHLAPLDVEVHVAPYVGAWIETLC